LLLREYLFPVFFALVAEVFICIPFSWGVWVPDLFHTSADRSDKVYLLASNARRDPPFLLGGGLATYLFLGNI